MTKKNKQVQYKVGDLVKLRKGLEVEKRYQKYSYLKSMEFEGYRKITMSSFDGGHPEYFIEGMGDWYYRNTMLVKKKDK